MRKRSPHRGEPTRRLLGLVTMLVVTALAPAAFAFLVPGGGPSKSDCYVELDVDGITAQSIASGKKVTCVDGDACDQGACDDGACTFRTAACINQTDPALLDCTAPPFLSKLTLNGMGVPLPSPLVLQGPVCGDGTDISVSVKKPGTNKEKPGKRKFKLKAKAGSGSPKTDTDNVQFICAPRTTACSTTTSTVVTPSTTSTTVQVCGNGMVERGEACDDGNADNTDACTDLCQKAACGDGSVQAGEACDPPCGAGCGGGQICNSQCQCAAQVACDCGAPDPDQVQFTSGVGAGTCGVVVDDAGLPLTINADMSPGLNCGGLYFGGRANAVPLPNSVPADATSISNTCCSDTTLTVIGAPEADTGSIRNCTARGCIFGPPLPVTNPNQPATSTCVINTLASNAVGQADCRTGESTLSAPLSSEVFLAGDLLFDCIGGNGMADCSGDVDCGGGFCPVGIQPCPICIDNTCQGGPNNGMSCVPGTSSTGDPYPTSHDCPPDPANTLGALPISFQLSTGTISETSVASGTQQRVFCGFCRDKVTGGETLCYAGNPMSPPCPEEVGLLTPCTSNADCTEPFETCEQNEPGAFAPGGGTARTITMFGAPAGDGTDRQPHPATLVGIFCVPPTFDPLVDNAANLPGPGAVAITGQAQLLPTP